MMKDTKENKQEVKVTTDKKEYQVEGYKKCSTALRRCAHDCLGTALWSADN